MTKQRSTPVKQQLGTAKKASSTDKKDKRPRSAGRAEPQATPVATGEFAALSPGEVNVLGIFKKYLMGPGQMLCLSNTDIDSSKIVFEKLVNGGLLIAEDFKGGYSLTQTGYKAMHEVG